MSEQFVPKKPILLVLSEMQMKVWVASLLQRFVAVVIKEVRDGKDKVSIPGIGEVERKRYPLTAVGLADAMLVVSTGIVANLHEEAAKLAQELSTSVIPATEKDLEEMLRGGQ